MEINTVNLANTHNVLLLEDIFPADLLNGINLLCDTSELDNPDWQHPDWTKLRKIYHGHDPRYLEIKNYLSGRTFTEQIEQVIQKKMQFSDMALWADYPGYGPLLPHMEQHGSGQGQIFLNRKEFITNGTTFMNDSKQALFTLAYRNNYGWYMDECTKIMHSREFDVPSDIVRYSLLFWHNYET